MKRVQKSDREPEALADYNRTFSHAPAMQTWVRFKKEACRRNSVKDQIRQDQRGLCCYCENALIPDDESVEHFISRSANHCLELVWNNLLLCCAGGERPLPESVADAGVRFKPGEGKTCGHAKQASTAVILNPLQIPAFPRLFRVSSGTGELIVDADKCHEAGIHPDIVNETIAELGLQAGRLNKARLATMGALMSMLSEPTGTDQPFSIERERRLASEQISSSGTLPGFFTTIRFILGDGCEQHLHSINYVG